MRTPTAVWLVLLTALGASSAAPAPKGKAHSGDAQVSGKVSRHVEKLVARDSKASVDVIVRFTAKPGAAQKQFLNGVGGRVRQGYASSRWIAVRLPARAVEALNRNPEVEFIASDPPMSFAQVEPGGGSGEPGPGGSNPGPGGAGVTIAMLDTGVQPSPDIQNLVAAVDLVVPGPPDPPYDPAGSIDPNGHGTHVAGILVGTGALSLGRYSGVAPAASLVSVRVLGTNGGGQASDVLAGLQWVLAHKDQFGIRVLNLSLGHAIMEPAGLDPLVEQVEALWDAGIVVVCSAGNAGRDGDGTITSPCNARDVITVGALNDRGTTDPSDDRLASYSSRGPTRFDMLAKPDLIASGNRIVSLRSAGSVLDQLFPERRVADDPELPEVTDYFEMSGTSMASPRVAGAVALMLSQDPSLNPATVKARLMRSALKPNVGNPLGTGAGALDIESALLATGMVAAAPSPAVQRDEITQAVGFENTAALWGDPTFSIDAVWSQSVLWSSGDPAQDPVRWSEATFALDPLVWPLAPLWLGAGDAPPPSTWPEGRADLWSESELWTEAELWAEAEMWSESTPPAAVDPLSLLTPDPS